MNQSPAQKQKALEDILKGVVADGYYEAALLSDGDGLLLAVAAPDETAAMMAAMTATLRSTAMRVHKQLELAPVDELSLVCDDRFHLVCRFLNTDVGAPLILTVVVPPNHSYRRITNQAITNIQAVLADE